MTMCSAPQISASAALLLCTIFSVISTPARGQGGLQVSAVAAPVNTLAISDIDFLNATSPKWLFTITASNSTGRTVPAVMTIRLDAFLAGGEQAYEGVVTLVTRAFILGPSLTATNLDIGGGRILRDSLYEKNSAAIKRVEQIALPSGTMPAGTYNFTVTVKELQGTATGSGTFSIILTNPTSVELLFPVEGDPSVSSLPLFQWQFDGYRSRLSVYEKLPGQTTLEEAASGTPHVVAEVSTRSYVYPAAGVRALEAGKTYVWFVEGLVATSGGTDIILKSPLRSFTVASTGSPSLSTLLDDLERSLDPKFKPVFDQIRSEGLSPSGGIRVNTAPITITEFLRVVSRLRGNPGSVLSVTLDE